MKRKTTFLLLLLPLSLFAQTLIPWRAANGLYGLANDAGKLLVPARYERVYLMQESENFANGRKNGADVLVFRNGWDCPAPGYAPRPFPVLFQKAPGTAPDTLRSLLALRDQRNMTLIHPASRKFQKFYSYFQSNLPNWFWFARHKPYQPCAEFIHGVCPVLDENRKINFIDTTLQLVFSGYWAAATVCDDQYFIVAENEHKMAIANHQGKIISPWYRQLQPTYTPGVFILNNSTGSATAGHAGLVDITGVLRIDTLYEYLEAVIGSPNVIVKHRNRAALFDIQGKILLPFDSCLNITNTGYNGYLKVLDASGRYYLCDPSGKKLLPGPFEQVDVAYRQDGTVRYFQGTNKGMVYWYTAEKQLILQDSLFRINEIEALSPPRFLSYKYQGKETLNGLLDASGRSLLPPVYREITPRYFNGKVYFRLNLNMRFGLADADGKILIPCELYGLETSVSENDTVLWKKTQPRGLWSAFDIQGRKKPYPDYHLPTTRQEDMFSAGHNDKGEQVFILADGSSIPCPDFLKKTGRVMQLRQGNGGYGLFKKQEEILIATNAQLQPILPAGYALLQKFFDRQRFKNTGLLPVYSLLGKDTLAYEKPREIPPQPERDMPPELAVVEEAPRTIEQNNTAEERSCGILDAQGAWVLSPKKGVHYIPVSPYLVLEMPFDEKRLPNRFAFNRQPYTIQGTAGTTRQFPGGQPFPTVLFSGIQRYVNGIPGHPIGSASRHYGLFRPVRTSPDGLDGACRH
jgi:hypothetical protein